MPQSTPRQKAIEGYARALDVPGGVFASEDVVVAGTERREQPHWGTWVRYVWCLSIDESLVCSATPDLSEILRDEFDERPASLVDETTLSRIRERIGDAVPGAEWVQREVLFYPETDLPDRGDEYDVEFISPDGIDDAGGVVPDAPFDGAFVVRVGDRPVSYAGLKAREEVVELAVETATEHRRRGIATAVTARALEAILNRGKVPIYIPDSLENDPSYGLAATLDFEHLGEMLCYEGKE